MLLQFPSSTMKLLPLLLLCLTTLLPAEDRVALVIGNNAYESAESLRNPRNDAAVLGGVLEGAGYQVTSLFDGDARQMARALLRFCQDHQGAESALFFYAGHGIEVGGQNYLLPVDAELREQADLKLETLPLREVLEQLAQAQIRL